jgi:hypothetical protein
MNDPLPSTHVKGGGVGSLLLFWLVVAVACGVAALWLNRKPAEPSLPVPATAPAVVSAPVETLARTVHFDTVFARALWRRPQPEDVIKNAERREWSDADGVTRWDWFLEVQPGPALRTWLDTNPFSLHKSESPTPSIPPAEAPRPEWFPKEAATFEVFVSSSSSFLMLRDPSSQKVYLSDSGGGLAKPIAR